MFNSTVLPKFLPMVIDKAEAVCKQSIELMPVNKNQVTIDSMLEVYKSVISDTDIFYCSVPITSGKRYIEWLEQIGKCFVSLDKVDEKYKKEHFKKVVEPNRIHAQQFIQRLREQSNCIVIDPTALPSLPGWAQQDWHLFWGKVIERYATKAFFIDDWQYSNGCVHEFWVAHSKDISIFDENKQPLTLELGIDLIAESVAVMRQRKCSTVALEHTLTKLKDLFG
jgi:hypothetical protein